MTISEHIEKLQQEATNSYGKATEALNCLITHTNQSTRIMTPAVTPDQFQQRMEHFSEQLRLKAEYDDAEAKAEFAYLMWQKATGMMMSRICPICLRHFSQECEHLG